MVSWPGTKDLVQAREFCPDQTPVTRRIIMGNIVHCFPMRPEENEVLFPLQEVAPSPEVLAELSLTAHSCGVKLWRGNTRHLEKLRSVSSCPFYLTSLGVYIIPSMYYNWLRELGYAEPSTMPLVLERDAARIITGLHIENFELHLSVQISALETHIEEDDDEADLEETEEDLNLGLEQDQLLQLVAELRSRAKIAADVKSFNKESNKEVDHLKKINDTLKFLEHRRQEFSWEESGMKSAIEQIKQGVERMIKIENSPLSTFPPPKGSSFYCDIINFGCESGCGYLVDLLTFLTGSHDNPLEKNDLLKIAQVFAQVTSNLNPSKTSAMKKVRMLGLKRFGISNEGLTSLAKLGLCQGASSWHREKSRMAKMDLELHKERIAKYTTNQKYDNLNFTFCGQQNDQTLIIQQYEEVDTRHLPSCDGKTFTEMLDLFEVEEIMITENQDDLNYFKTLMLRSAARVVGTVEGFGWVKEELPGNYQHVLSEYAATKSKIHFEVPLNLNENSNGDHEQIMQVIQRLKLEATEAKLSKEDVKKMQDDVKFCREFNEDEDEEENLDEAQARIKERVREDGDALNWSDQGTSEKQRSAVELRRGDYTDLEKLAYVRNMNFSGFFHVQMTMTIQNIRAMIDDVNFGDDEGSLSNIAKLLSKRIITEDKNTGRPDEGNIKNNYQKCQKFFKQVSDQHLKIAFETFIHESGRRVYNKSTEGAIELMTDFFEKKGIQWIWDFEKEFSYVDRAQAVGADMIVRGLIFTSLDMVIHLGDAQGLHVMTKVLVMFFLAREQPQRSKYAREMLLNVIKYKGLSSRSKMRHDLYFKVNLSGKPGKCVSSDMVVEWCVR